MAACGGSDLDPGAGNAAGAGTGTLVINGSAHASPRLINARMKTEFDTELTVRVSRDDQPITTGTVTITSASGKVALTYRANENHWTGSAPNYDEVYVLDVVSGADRLEGVRVDGPDIHVFSEPSEGANIETTMPLTIRWDRGDEAFTTQLRADTFEPITIPDTGTYSLASGSLKADKSQPWQQTLRLLRTNHVVPSGAPGGSWDVTIENRLDVIAQVLPIPL
ncbi:MAG TPA: hypothetical protein VFT22_05945 [Kofleriaceae bacterium]|nr:hypothetical protein [Kofleriaceae bacterium]